MCFRITLLIGFYFAIVISAYSQVKQIDSLKNVLKRLSQTDTTYINTLNEIALAYWAVQADSVLALSKKSEKLCREMKYLKGEAEAVKNIGIAYRIKGNNEEALKFFLKALPMAEKAGYGKGIGGCYNNIAIIYNTRGQYDQALKYHEKAVEIREKIGDKKDLSTSYNNIGVIFTNLGRYSEAMEYHLKSLRLREQINDKVGIGMSLNNVANMHERLGQYDEELEYLVRALRIQEEVGDKVGVASSLVNLGILYLRKGNDSLALNFQLRALKTTQEANNEQLVGRVLLKIAYIYFKKNQLTKSLDYYRQAESKMKKIGDKSGISEVLEGMAQVYLHEKKYKDALAIATRSLNVAKEIGNLERVNASHQTLSNIYEAMGDGLNALYHFKQYKAYSDNLNNKEIERRTSLQQAQYDYEKKEMQLRDQQRIKEIEYEREANQQQWIIFSALLILCSVSVIAVLAFRSRGKLKKANLEIEKQKVELHDANVLKARLLSVVSHDARGPLNSLSGMLKLLAHDVISPEESKKLLEGIGVQLEQVRDFMETLLHWVRQQVVSAEPDFKNFEIDIAITETVDLLMSPAEAKKVNLVTHLEEGLMIRADEEMIRIVVRNLVSNAIKFCREYDSVEISASSNAEKTLVKVMVSDTGVGISAENLSKLFGEEHISTKGTGKEIGTGLGLLLCKQYIELNGGKMGVQSQDRKGSQFWFTIPMAKEVEIQASTQRTEVHIEK